MEKNQKFKIISHFGPVCEIVADMDVVMWLHTQPRSFWEFADNTPNTNFQYHVIIQKSLLSILILKWT